MRGDLLHLYEPWGACKELWKCRATEVLLAGPAGTGKSRGCLERLHYLCSKKPGIKALILRKTQVSLASTALDTFEKFVIGTDLIAGTVRFHGGGPRTPPQYQYNNGSVVNIGGMDNATKIMSSEYDLIYIQEATELTVDDLEMASTRMRNGVLSFQQIIMDCNPVQPTHWLNRRCQAGTTTMIVSRHEDNPTLFHRTGTMTLRGVAYIRGVLDKLTGVRYLRLRKGIWAAAEGMVYEDWDDAVHLIDKFEIPKSWNRWWSVDFGYVNPFVCQFWAEDPDGRLYLYREIYHTRKIVRDHASDILATVTDANGKWTEPQPMAVICDHDAEDRATLEDALEMGTYPAQKSISRGIQAVQKRLRVLGDGKPRIFIMRGALVKRDQELVDSKFPTCTWEEIAGFIWDTSGNKAPKEVPVDRDNHGMDAKRYVVAEHDLGGRPRLRSF